MTRKHYEAIASVIAENTMNAPHDDMRPEFGTDKVIGKVAIVNALAELFKQDNPRFDAEKFRKACGS